MPAAQLHVQLDYELPRRVMVGCGTALFVCGWCFHPDAAVRSLAILVDDDNQPVMAHGMPRLDPFRALKDSPADPQHHSYRSGFWGLARIAGPRATATCRLALRAELDDGSVSVAELGNVEIEPTRRPVSPIGSAEVDASHVTICMATYNPPLDLLERQLASIREQSHTNWTCLISDDCSSRDHHGAILAATAGDARFVVSRSPRRLGFYGNFERALMMVPPESAFVALADQDDRWHPNKLETLISAIGGAQLVYSDARVVGRGGELISETWWNARRNNHSDLLSLLVANSVTGAASLMRGDLLDYALPFPPAQFAHFHDHWLGLVGLALGDVAFVDRPLYDYVQHGEASLGHAAANQIVSLRTRIRHQSAPRERVRMWRLNYYADVCRLMQFATILKMRCEARMTPGKRRALNRFLDADRSPVALTRLGLRGAGELLSSAPETLGAEWMLFWAMIWRRMLAASARERPQRRLRLDAIPPPTLIAQPRRSGADEQARAIAAKVAPLRFVRSEHAPRRINVLIPTIDPDHFFGGYIAKFNLARRLSQGGATVRIVTVDPVGALPPDWRETVESYSGLRGLFDEIEVIFGREAAEIEMSPADGVVATTWWTAHVARAAMTLLDSDRFVYLIQEYEPFTFPMGSYAALAGESYRFGHFALFSSELLRGYFRRHGIGVYAHGSAEGDRESLAFENAITPVAAPRADELALRNPRRLLFYARPESHAARNMFELGVLALAQALDDGLFRNGWELHGIGTVSRSRRIALGADVHLKLMPRSDQRSYAHLLREHDVGLALMYTPHPSLVPIEMAAGGMLTVTNTFENKTADALKEISPNLVPVDPSIDAIADGLREAATRVTDFTGRAQGSRVRWSRDWYETFDDDLIARLRATLETTTQVKL